MKRRIAILGATGSIGRSTLDLVERSPQRFEVVALTAQKSVAALADAARRTGAKLAVIADAGRFDELRTSLDGSGCRAAAGPEGLLEAAACEAEWVMAAIVGCAGLVPTMAAIEAGKTVALANKEALVTAGSLMTDAAQRSGATLLPVDSEHNAIFQCLAGSRSQDVSRLVLTASGGPFRERTLDEMRRATPAQAVAHPKWSMGAKISVDSATLMTKGLELIEAHHLFGLPYDAVEVVIHPQSIVHAFVEFCDGSVIAQLAFPSMELPILYALTHPGRLPDRGVRPFDPVAAGPLTFEPVRTEVFRAFSSGVAAGRAGGTAPAVFNAANEAAVAAFLEGCIQFGRISQVIERVLDAHRHEPAVDVETVQAADRWARRQAHELLR
jgi:1-deoxy-D-xylulose-5-phosphate reductoisomerase